MSKSSLTNQSTTSRGIRMRQFGRTESESSGPEGVRLTEDGDQDDDGSLMELELPPPPDGGYGWVIVFASFMCNLIVDGIAYTFGIFLPEFVDTFHVGKGTVAWVGSLLSGMYLAAGPVVSALCNKYGCRAVCIAGSFIASSAFVLSSLSTSVTMLMLTYGVIGGYTQPVTMMVISGILIVWLILSHCPHADSPLSGIGFGMIYLPAVVAVGYYFETKRSLATGIAVCGSGVGTFAFAPLATALLDMYGWRGSNLILAGLILNCAVFGALMRPLVYPKESVKPLLQRLAEVKRAQMERGSISGSYFVVQLPDGTMEKRMKMPLNVDPGVHSSFNLNELAPGTLTPVPTMPTLPNIPTLPTISEAKMQEHAESETGRQDPELCGTGIGQIYSRHRVAQRAVASSQMPRNVSSPAFTTPHQGLPKNGSVPFFDRVRKTSTGERFKPSLAAIKSSSRASIDSSTNNRRLSSNSVSGRNNNADYYDTESMYNSKMSLGVPREAAGKMVRPLSRKDIFYSRSVVNLPEYQSTKSLSHYRQSVLSLAPAAPSSRAGDVERSEHYDLCPCCHVPESFKSALASMMDMSLLKNPSFMAIGISNLFGMAGLYVPFVYLVDAAILNGIEKEKASFLLSIIGITNTVGRVACGWVADFPWMNSLLLNNICLVISTIAVTLTPYCSSYPSYIAMAIFFGFAISGYISLTSIILVDLLGLDKLTNAFGLLILFRGAAAIVGSPLAGAVYDATNSYDTSFFMAGAFFGIATITSFMAPMMKRFDKSEVTAQNPDALTPIDEEDMDDEDPDDTPITMGMQPTHGGASGNGSTGGAKLPQIVHTAASPLSTEAPSRPGDRQNGAEVKQIESVL